MANKKISELPAAGALSGPELVEVVKGGINSQTTAANIIGLSVSDTAFAGSWDGVNTIAPSKNAVYDEMILKQYLANTAVAITDAATMDITGPKHTLATSSATRTFTQSWAGDFTSIIVTLSATSSVFTFPAGALCVSDGLASGDNTLPLNGVSGDKYYISISKFGSAYYVVSKNFGQ